LTENNLERFRR
jgi:hypothetical protein